MCAPIVLLYSLKASTQKQDTFLLRAKTEHITRPNHQWHLVNIIEALANIVEAVANIVETLANIVEGVLGSLLQ